MRLIFRLSQWKAGLQDGKEIHARIARDLKSQRSFAKQAVLFCTAPKVIPYPCGRAGTVTAGLKIAFITFNARRVPFTTKTTTVQLRTMSTTTNSRLPSDAHIMASSLEWEVLTVLTLEIAGEILNLMNLLRWLCSVCLILVLKCYNYEHATRHSTSSSGSFF